MAETTEIFSDKTRAHYGEHLHRIGDAVGAAVLAMDEQDMDGYDAAMTVVSNTVSRLREDRLADFDDEETREMRAANAKTATVTVQVYEISLNKLFADIVGGS